MLVTLNEVLPNASRRGYAVGAFNVYNLETAKAVLTAAIAEKSPVILQTSESALEYAGLESLTALLLDMAERAPVPVVIHLDHGRNPDIIARCIANGFRSVMFDASSLPEREKVAVTKKLVTLAHRHSASIEGELDSIGGKEDYVEGDFSHFTDPDKAAQFVDKTGLDAFAVSIGNIHGNPLPNEILDIDRLQKVAAKVAVPLVLHGASGTPPCQIQAAIAAGITKINIDTDLRHAFMEGIHLSLEKNPQITNPRDLLTDVQDVISEAVASKIRLFGSSRRVHV